MKYRKKPVVIEAIMWLGDNFDEIKKWSAEETKSAITRDLVGDGLLIHTLEGIMRADKGDWIIRGVKGEYYPCKPDIFDQTYEPITERGE